MISFGQSQTKVLFTNSDKGQMELQIEQSLTNLLLEFNSAYKASRTPKLQNQKVTPEGIARILKIWENASFFSPEITINENLLQTTEESTFGKGYQVRNIKLTVKGKDGTTSSKNAVINFNSSGLVEELYFGIELHDYNAIKGDQQNPIEFARRQIILDVIENFKTAYNRKDYEFINNIFSDNALIIVGKTVKQTQLSDFGRLDEKKVELTVKTKQQYLETLQKVFATNAFIDVDFEKINIMKHPKYPQVYGVNLTQSWTSSNYSDQGYLFLMIDFRDEKKPVIHVRSWQPTSDTPIEEVIELGDFKINN
jgi:hypothetical protein